MANSIKDLATSVDWSKLLSNSDAKRALIGSALGGLLVGGASALQDRDPEESKYAPVGDALMGALLGGVAGYGIPKGLSLFRDAGAMAPDNDQLTGGYGSAMRNGALWGGAAAGGTMVRPVGRGIWKSLIDRAKKNSPQKPMSGFWRDITKNMVRDVPVDALPDDPSIRQRIFHRLKKTTNGRGYRSSSITLPIRTKTPGKLFSLKVGPKSKMLGKGVGYAAAGAAISALAHAIVGNSARDNFKN